jgi:hypothetical protein
VGVGWQAVIQELLTRQGENIPDVQRQWVYHATDVDTAFQRLQEMLSDDKFTNKRNTP